MKRLNNYFFGVDKICESDMWYFYGSLSGGVLSILFLLILGW